MARTKISEFSSTPGNNTDIDNINIAEGCAPSGINNAIRELMAQLKDFQAGTAGDSFNGPIGTTTAAAGVFTTLSASGAFTYGGVTLSNAVTGTGNMVLSNSPTLVTPALGTPSALVGTNITGTAAGLSIGGNAATATSATTAGSATTATTSTNVSGGTASVTTLTTSSTVTHNGGTANGVAYLNGSKVLTTGSALTFDGSNVTLQATSPAVVFNNSSGTPAFQVGYIGGTNRLQGRGTVDAPMTFYVSDYEIMRLTSTGLGIGTSSPASKLHVGVVGGGVIARFAHTGETNNPYAYFKTNEAGNLASLGSFSSGGNSALGFLTADTERARITSGGDFGVGTTSPTTFSGFRTLELANSGGSAISLVTGSSVIAQTISSSTNSLVYMGSRSNHALVLTTNDTERARITSGGALIVGGTAQVGGNEKLSVQQTGSTRAAVLRNDAGANWDTLLVWNEATSGDNLFQQFSTEAAVTIRGSISYNRGAGLTAYNTTSDYRAKDIIGPVTDSGALIDSVPVYMGKMKGATQERPMFIAHEVPAYAHTGVKDAVDADGNPVYQQMDASALVPVLWAELQSLRARVAALESN